MFISNHYDYIFSHAMYYYGTQHKSICLNNPPLIRQSGTSVSDCLMPLIANFGFYFSIILNLSAFKMYNKQYKY